MQASWNSKLDQQKQKQLSERSMKFEALQTTLHTTLDSQRCATLTTGSEKPTEPLFHEAEDCAMSHATTLTTVPMSCHLYTFVILWQSAVIRLYGDAMVNLAEAARQTALQWTTGVSASLWALLALVNMRRMAHGMGHMWLMPIPDDASLFNLVHVFSHKIQLSSKKEASFNRRIWKLCEGM